MTSTSNSYKPKKQTRTFVGSLKSSESSTVKELTTPRTPSLWWRCFSQWWRLRPSLRSLVETIIMRWRWWSTGFFIFDVIAPFTSLAVVVVQIALVRGETKAERKVVENSIDPSSSSTSSAVSCSGQWCCQAAQLSDSGYSNNRRG